MESVDAPLELLARSDNRSELLLALDADAPLDRYDLEERLGASRRTVTRALNTLEDRGYIRTEEGGYGLTALGAGLARAYRRYRETASVAARFEPLLREAGATELDFDVEWLRGADLTLATESSPFALLDRSLELRAGASTIREVAPSVEGKSVTQLADRIRAGEDIDVEVVLPVGALEAARSHPDYADEHAVVAESDAVDVYIHPEPVRLFLAVLDETVAVGTAVDGEPTALAVSEDPDLRAWADRRIDEYRAAAIPAEEY